MTVSLAHHLVEVGYTTFARDAVRHLKLEDPQGIILRGLHGLTNVGPGLSDEHRAPPDERDTAEVKALCHGGT